MQLSPQTKPIHELFELPVPIQVPLSSQYPPGHATLLQHVPPLFSIKQLLKQLLQEELISPVLILSYIDCTLCCSLAFKGGKDTISSFICAGDKCPPLSFNAFSTISVAVKFLESALFCLKSSAVRTANTFVTDKTSPNRQAINNADLFFMFTPMVYLIGKCYRLNINILLICHTFSLIAKSQSLKSICPG